MMGFPLLNFIHPGDVDLVTRSMEKLARDITNGATISSRVQFRCRMKERSQPRTEVVTYQVVLISGSLHVEPSEECDNDSDLVDNSTPRKRPRESSNPFSPIPSKAFSPLPSNTLSPIPSNILSPIPSKAFSPLPSKAFSPLPSPASSSSIPSQCLMFKGFVQVIPTSPSAELSLIDANQEEYVTRLSLDGTLLYADHR